MVEFLPRLEKLRTETIVAAIFARRMGLSRDCLHLPRLGPDEAGPDAILKLGTPDVVVELTMADPEGSGTLPPHRRGTDILTGGLRAAYQRLLREFNALAVKPLGAAIEFLTVGDAKVIHLPKAHHTSMFVGELSEFAFRLTARPDEFRRSPHRAREAIKVYNFDGFSTLKEHCYSVEFWLPPKGHSGWLSSIQFEALWSVYADIDFIVQSKAQKSHADWLVVFEWCAPGALPPNDMLQPIRPSVFKRVFMLDPAMPGRLLEWVGTGWEVPEAFEDYNYSGEIDYVDCFLEKRSIPTIRSFHSARNANC